MKMKRDKLYRWLLLPIASAVLLVVSGLACLTWPESAMGLLPRVMGFGLVAAGLVQLWFYFGQHSLRFLPEFGWVVGAASLLVGGVFLFNPHVSMVFVGICGGMWAIVLSVVRGRAALKKRTSGRPWKTHLVGSGLYLACGLGLLCSPFTGMNLAARLVGLVMVAAGAGLLYGCYGTSRFLMEQFGDNGLPQLPSAAPETRDDQDDQQDCTKNKD